MSKFKSLPKKYDRLDNDEKNILYVLSVIYQPIEITPFNTILSNLHPIDTKNKCLKLEKPRREALIKTGLLQYQQSKLRCAPEVVDYISQTHGNKEAFKKAADIAEKMEWFASHPKAAS